ncbi:MAG: hypothetical protein GY774_17935 [Planctomycetes bacterium]|nr:hypothetical protein [Planctomycetota bacterium]
MARQRYRIRVEETREDYVWIEAYSWEEAQELARTSKRDLAQCEFMETSYVGWTGDTEEIK